MQLLKPSEYKLIMDEQGRKPAWIAKKLDCSYSLVYKYLNDIKPMKQERIEQLHKILIG